MNQCDGCRAGKPLDENHNHRMGAEGTYANLQACVRKDYERPDMKIKLRAEKKGDHYHTTVFVDGANAGTLVLRTGEYPLFAAALVRGADQPNTSVTVEVGP